MAQPPTAKELHDDLLADLAAGTHTFDGRGVLAFDEFTGDEGTVQAGKRVVSIQYAGKDGGGGGLLREYAFDPADLAEPKPAKDESKAADKAAKDDVVEVVVEEKPSSPSKSKGSN